MRSRGELREHSHLNSLVTKAVDFGLAQNAVLEKTMPGRKSLLKCILGYFRAKKKKHDKNSETYMTYHTQKVVGVLGVSMAAWKVRTARIVHRPKERVHLGRTRRG